MPDWASDFSVWACSYFPSSKHKLDQMWRQYIRQCRQKTSTHRTFPMARLKCLMEDFTNLYEIYKAHQTNVWWSHSVFQITASPSARSRQLWRRTGNFLKTFLQFYVYDLRFKAAGLATFLVEFWTLVMNNASFSPTLIWTYSLCAICPRETLVENIPQGPQLATCETILKH